jgi:hypothetical protein
MSSSVSGSTTGFAQPPNIKNFVKTKFIKLNLSQKSALKKRARYFLFSAVVYHHNLSAQVLSSCHLGHFCSRHFLLSEFKDSIFDRLSNGISI